MDDRLINTLKERIEVELKILEAKMRDMAKDKKFEFNSTECAILRGKICAYNDTLNAIKEIIQQEDLELKLLVTDLIDTYSTFEYEGFDYTDFGSMADKLRKMGYKRNG